MESSTNKESNAAQEKKARKLLAQGRFRKARDEFKLLCKIDRSRYLPDLIQANIGLVKEMLAKGQTPEAEQVIAYLRTIATKEQLHSLDLALVLKAPATEENLTTMVRQLHQSNLPISDADKIQMADRLVVAFNKTTLEVPAAAGLMAEVRTIHDAFKAVSQEQWSQAAEALRPLPHGSCFGHWKLYVKGIAAFYQGEIQKAVEALTRLPANSIPARASQPLLLIAGSKPEKAISEEGVIDLCRWMDQPVLGRPLFQAEQFWSRHEAVKSYEALRGGIQDFPSDAHNGLGVLSDFYFSAASLQSRDVCFEWEEFLYRIIDRSATKNPVEKRRALRAITVASISLPEISGIKEDMDAFLELHQKLHGANPRLESQACYWLSNYITGDLSSFDNRSAFNQKPPHADMVVELLVRSRSRDPENLPAGLKLCQIYRILGQTSDHNHLLDRLTVQFPDEKAVLLLAGQACIDRRAMKKGIQYLERAYELDRIDPAIKTTLVTARQTASLYLMLEFKAGKARELLAQNEPLLADESPQLVLNRWAHRIAQGTLELIAHDLDRSESLFEEARRLSPSIEVFSYHAQKVCHNLSSNRTAAAIRHPAAVLFSTNSKVL